MPDIKANRDFDKFSYEEQIRILRYMYDFINSKYYNSQLPHDIDIRIHIMSSNTAARYKKPDIYDPAASQHRIEFNELIICKKPFSHHDVWVSFLEDTISHEMVHLFNGIRGIHDVNTVFKDGKFTVLGYHNKYFKKTVLEHGQTCERLDSRNGFSDTHLIIHFPLESWITK